MAPEAGGLKPTAPATSSTLRAGLEQRQARLHALADQPAAGAGAGRGAEAALELARGEVRAAREVGDRQRLAQPRQRVLHRAGVSEKKLIFAVLILTVAFFVPLLALPVLTHANGFWIPE